MGNIETVLSGNIVAIFFVAFVVAEILWYYSDPVYFIRWNLNELNL